MIDINQGSVGVLISNIGEDPTSHDYLDHDSDVDLADFATFRACFNGPNRPPTDACFPG